MLIETATKWARRYMLGAGQEFVFKHIDDIELPRMDKIDLYIHIPFCKNVCPYCPYNKIKYDKKLVKPYVDAMLNEIEQYHRRLGEIEIDSIYIGGGTPTNLIDELAVILKKIRESFILTGDIAIETNPDDINGEVINKLKRCGVTLLSLGVQSFNDKCLVFLGRSYKANILSQVATLALSSNFESVNIDLMFALPGQSISDVINDLRQSFSLGADQVTLYPLFTFPYSAAGKYLKLKRIKMPNIFTRRKMYKAIHQFCLNSGFQRVSVWGFKKDNVPRYSSVTRDCYIGLGAGAGSFVSSAFYFNTFSIREYIKTLSSGKLPVALKMGVGKKLSRYYWLYWRLYDTYIPKKYFKELFGEEDKKIYRLLWLSKILGLCREETNQFSLTERGAFWLHLMQNYFVLNYINKVWSVAMKEAWPDRIKI